MNTGLSEEKKQKIKRKQKTFFYIILIIAGSVAILYFLIKVLFFNSSVNQGKFRLIDIAIINTAKLEDTSQYTGKWSFDIIQSNLLTLLIQSSGDATVKEAYISDLSCSGACKDVKVYSKLTEENTTKSDMLNTKVYEDGTIIYEIIIDNNILHDFIIPKEITKIKYDGTIFKVANLSIKDVSFNVKFNINIVETTGRVNRLQIKLNLPNESLIEDGSSILRLEPTDFVFRTKLF